MSACAHAECENPPVWTVMSMLGPMDLCQAHTMRLFRDAPRWPLGEMPQEMHRCCREGCGEPVFGYWSGERVCKAHWSELDEALALETVRHGICGACGEHYPSPDPYTDGALCLRCRNRAS